MDLEFEQTPGDSERQRSLVCCSSRGHKELDMTSVQFSCSVVSNSAPMDCSTQGFPVHHQLLEPTQTHVRCVSDAIQPSHPLSSPSPPTFTPWTVDHQAPISMGFSWQEHWSVLPCPPLGDLSNPGIKPRSPALRADSLPYEPPEKLFWTCLSE